jgi:hypothetical protein
MHPHPPSLVTTMAVIAFAVSISVACGDTNDTEKPKTDATAASAAQSSPPRKAADQSDPCALVTIEEASEVLAGPAKSERPSEANIGTALTTCRYIAPRGEALAVMTVLVRRDSSAAAAKSGFQNVKQEFSGTENAAGIGDDAFYLGDQLHILSGSVYLIIGGLELEKAKPIATKAVSRLPR